MSSTCAIEGNPDLYGLGVRAGLYAQWGATLLATVFDPKSESTFRLANLIIQTAIFLGLCNEADYHKNIVGAVITQWLLCGSLSSVTGDGISHLGHASGMLRILFYIALSSYGCWFWFIGIENMSQKCASVIIFFGEAGLDSWARTAGKVLAVGGLVVSVAMAVLSVWATFHRFRDGLEAGFRPAQRQRPRVELGLLILSMGLLGLSIAAVEYLIHVNHVKNVTLSDIESVGQLIPLLAGVVASALTLWKILMHGLLWKRRCWFFLGWHL